MIAIALCRRTLAAAIAISLAVAIAGCGGGDKHPTAPTDPVPGTYTLREVDGLTMPAEVHAGPWYDPVAHLFYNHLVLRVTEGAVTLTSNKHYTARFDFEGTADGDTFTGSLAGQGAYAVLGDSIAFTATDTRVGDLAGTLQRGTIAFEVGLLAQVRPYRFVLTRWITP